MAAARDKSDESSTAMHAEAATSRPRAHSGGVSTGNVSENKAANRELNNREPANREPANREPANREPSTSELSPGELSKSQFSPGFTNHAAAACGIAGLPGMWTLAWPGLPRLWMAGQWRGLATAFVFSVMLNAALLATFDSLGSGSRYEMGTLWAATSLFWLVSARNSHSWRKALARLPKQEECDRQFATAQEAYLKGHWPEAESWLRRLLEARPEDLEGRLLLATLLRRMDRLADAKSQLEDFSRRSGAERWSLEFHREWEALKRQRTAADESPMLDKPGAAHTASDAVEASVKHSSPKAAA
jgi:hypothetical protein